MHLAEGEIDQAIEALRRLAGPGHSYYATIDLRLEVASAAESARPEAALEIYQQHAAVLIGLRARHHYREACRLLTRIRKLYESIGGEKDWASYLGVLRERHSNLRALKEELALASLRRRQGASSRLTCSTSPVVNHGA